MQHSHIYNDCCKNTYQFQEYNTVLLFIILLFKIKLEKMKM